MLSVSKRDDVGSSGHEISLHALSVFAVYGAWTMSGKAMKATEMATYPAMSRPSSDITVKIVSLPWR